MGRMADARRRAPGHAGARRRSPTGARAAPDDGKPGDGGRRDRRPMDEGAGDATGSRSTGRALVGADSGWVPRRRGPPQVFPVEGGTPRGRTPLCMTRLPSSGLAEDIVFADDEVRLPARSCCRPSEEPGCGRVRRRGGRRHGPKSRPRETAPHAARTFTFFAGSMREEANAVEATEHLGDVPRWPTRSTAWT